MNVIPDSKGGAAQENPYRSPAEVAYTLPAPETATEPEIIGRSSGGRFLAAQIDFALVFMVFFTVGVSLGEVLGDLGTGVVALAASLAYYAVPEWLFGASIGKAAFSLRVRQLSGAPCTPRQIVVRTLLRLVELNPLFLGPLPAGISILVTQRKQRLGDLLAGTVVVHSNDLSDGDDARPAVRVVRRVNS